MSPVSEPATPHQERLISPQPPSKRRRLSIPSSAPEKDYNLRSRASNTITPLAQSFTSTTSSNIIPSPPSTSQTRITKTMPRKGSRATRAARAKARAVEDGESDQDESYDAGEELVGNQSGETPLDVQMHKTETSEKVVDQPEQIEGANDMSIAMGEGGSEDDGDDDDDDNNDGEGDDEDDDDDDEDEEEGGGNPFQNEDDDEDDENDRQDLEDGMGMGYEASLGLGTEGGGLGDYNSGGESDSIDAPQTYDANGSPLPSSSSFDRLAAEDALEEAAELAAAHGLGGGAAAAGFRALHGLMSGMSNRLKGILATLRSKDGESSAKVIALQDLAELLSVSTEDTLSGYFQVEAFVKEIVSILRGDSNSSGGESIGGASGMTAEEMIAFGMDPSEGGGGGGDDEENNVQMMLLACRCLANLMEALPGSAHSVVYAGAVPVLCSKLTEIQYIDLAEQTLSVRHLFLMLDL